MCFLVNASASKPLDIATSNFAGALVHRMKEGTIAIFCLR